MELIIFFLILVLGAALIAWIIQGCPAPRRVDHYHYHRYKKSTDYERLWDLLVNYNMHIVVDHGPGVFRYDEARRGNDEYDKDRIYGIGEHMKVSEGKDHFVHYCAYKCIKFFDLADEVTE